MTPWRLVTSSQFSEENYSLLLQVRRENTRKSRCTGFRKWNKDTILGRSQRKMVVTKGGRPKKPLRKAAKMCFWGRKDAKINFFSETAGYCEEKVTSVHNANTASLWKEKHAQSPLLRNSNRWLKCTTEHRVLSCYSSDASDNIRILLEISTGWLLSTSINRQTGRQAGRQAGRQVCRQILYPGKQGKTRRRIDPSVPL